MRKPTSLASLAVFALVSSLTLFAQTTRIVVVGPDDRPIGGAHVYVLSPGTSKVIAQTSTASDGAASIAVLAGARVKVVADGFAAETVDAAAAQPIKLRIAASPENVTVTAAALPLSTDESGIITESLSGKPLEALQPVSLGDALQFLPGVVVADSGQRGGQSSLFVRGGDSDYNKVIIDGVPVDNPGGFFDVGNVPTQEFGRVELVRGPESAVYANNAMTSAVQLFTATGTAHTPELRFGADGGNFSTAHGYASLAGAFRKIDYNFFGDQFNTKGSGVNDDYSNSSEGANIGYAITPNAALRFNVRHWNSRTGVQSEWWFNGAALLPPDRYQFARQNQFLADLSLSFKTGNWQHTVSGYEYHHKIFNDEPIDQGDRITPYGDQDYPFETLDVENRAGFRYQGTWTPALWAHSAIGYEYENENGYDNDRLNSPNAPLLHGLRQNNSVFAEQFVSLKRLTVLAGGSYINNQYFGTRWLPRATATLLLAKGNGAFSGTRLRASYGQAVKEPSFEQQFGIGTYLIQPNFSLRPEQSRSVEAGFTQSFLNDRFSFAGTYFHQTFDDQIAYEIIDYTTFASQYINLNRTLAQGAGAELHARIRSRWSTQGSYFYTSMKILSAPLSTGPLQSTGSPLLRRPKHAGTLLLDYAGTKWGGDVGGSFIGARPDEDFYGYDITHAAGYALINLNGWHTLNRFTTAYAQIENALDRRYNSIVGYPGLPIDFRVGLRFKLGGD